MPKVAVLGGSFDPPSLHHRTLAALLRQTFDEVIVIPYGARSDHRTVSDTPPEYRAAMADLAFRGISGVDVELFSLEEQSEPLTSEIERRFASRGELSYVVPMEFVRGGHACSIRSSWERGEWLWANGSFVILRQGHEPLAEELPAHHTILQVGPYLPASAIRGRIYNQETVEEWLTPEVCRYVIRHGLYRSLPPRTETMFRVDHPRVKLYYDEANADSRQLAKDFNINECDPDLIVVLGGDGTMLRAIRKHWRDRCPFYGLNTGHLGFLLNDRETRFWEQELKLYQLPLLWAEAVTVDGKTVTGHAFNEVWVERATGQTAWVKLSINGVCRIERLVCDGALVSTSAGSTSYAKAMGATPLPFNTPVLTIVGSNVLTPMGWRPAVLPIHTEVEMTTLDTDKRPLMGYMDGVPLGRVSSVKVRVSRTAAVELAFQTEHDPVAKLARLQFPLG
ncbi:NAD(+)/NADH kinase [Zavarzinella formosa]|uniref:NAD(+)/NADH kinase n=1 Tax=Zavarzinella formosa TaxID=360055 RepID=UPI000308F69B|nr:NAD(+)/NADH kinase [Zavarzinella formosa]